MRRSLYAILAPVLFVFFALPMLGQAPPSADAFVTDTQPARNFGSGVLLPVQAGTTSYICLNLGVLPANATIAKATLRLYVNAFAAPGSFDVFQVKSAWSEKGITFDNAPLLGASATGGNPIAVTAALRSQFILVDITSLVQSWLNGSTPNDGIALALTSVSGSFAFDSKESMGTGHQPELEVVLGSTVTVSQDSSSGVSADSSPSQSTGVQSVARSFALGHGSKGYLTMWLNTVYLGSSTLYQDIHNNLGIGTTTPVATLDVNGAINTSSQYMLGGSPVLSASPADGQGLTGGNVFVGLGAGSNNILGWKNTGNGLNALASDTTGQVNTASGANALQLNTTGSGNTADGADVLSANTTGSNNTAVGWGSGANTTTGSGNSFFGNGAGQNNTTGNGNVYIANAGPSAGNESSTIRIGDSANHSSTYIAGINGASTNSGAPVFVDSNGKLGTGGGAVNFTQVTGTLSSPQFTGTYNNPVTLSNTTNVFNGSFTGDGSGLTGVTSGSFWPVVNKSADYTIQTSEFSTATTPGKFVVLTGSIAHTFTLPSVAPPNGSCVAIGDFALSPVGSNTNVYLTVSSNGLTVDGASAQLATQSMSGWESMLYCSDGIGYWRMGHFQTTPSTIGPWLKTVDTGTVNALKTTFVHGMYGGMSPGTMFYILPVNTNTSSTVTLSVNGYLAKNIFKFGNQPLAPGDLTTTAYAHVFYDGTNWQLLNPQTAKGTITSVTATAPLVSSGGTTPSISCPTCITTAALSGTTGSIGGSALTAGSCTTGTAAITGAVVGHPVAVSASDGSLPNGQIILSAAVTSADTVTVQLCAVGNVTPIANTYNVTTQ